MARKVLIEIRRGAESNLAAGTLADGEFGYTIDTKKLFIGYGGQNICIGAASSLGDMLKSVYDTDSDGIVDAAESVPWNGVQNKPSTFPPSSHDHQQIVIPDTRSVATSPSDYSKKLLIQFKSSSVVGLSGGTYCTILGFRGWSDDSGDTAHEIGFQSDGVIKARTGTTASGWGAWKTLRGPLTWNDLKGV